MPALAFRARVRYDSAVATTVQRVSVGLAFLAALLSFVAVAVEFSRSGRLAWTPLGGGMLMLALGISGLLQLRTPKA